MLQGNLFSICVLSSILSFGIVCLFPRMFQFLPSVIEAKMFTESPDIIRAATSLPSTDHLLKEYPICHASDFASYACKGPAYDNFADKLEALVLDQDHTRRLNSSDPSFPIERKPPLWGKRQQSPFPANTTILALGNSHTRQVLHALICQYPALQKIDMESKKSGNMNRRGSYYFVEFVNHAKLHLVTNNAIFYSKQWPRYLNELVHVDSLSDFDALIVGKMNTFVDAYNTSFMELMIEKTAALEDADFSTNRPPSLLDFAKRYKGPIVAHSMFNDWGGKNKKNHQYVEMERMVKSMVGEKNGRENIRLVNGREYIPVLGECGSTNHKRVGDCADDATAHRCVGARGGHPDLVAWDVVEALHHLWGSSRVPSF